MAKLLQVDHRPLAVYEARSAAGFPKRRGRLSKTDETVKLSRDFDSSEPGGVVLVKACKESRCDLSQHLTMCFLCFLQRADKFGKFRAVVASDLCGGRHLIPGLRHALDGNRELQLVD